MIRRIGAIVGLLVLAVAGLAVAGVRPALGTNVDDHRVTICHHVEGNGNTGNGYNIETVDKDSISTLPNGHDGHPLDIIPAFPAGSTTGPPPKQWNAYPGKGDASLIGTNCVAPDTTSTGTTTTTDTTTTDTTTTTETTTTTDTTTTTTTTPPPPPPCPITPDNPTGTIPDPGGGQNGNPGNDICKPDETTTQETTTTTTPNDSVPLPTTTEPPVTTTEPPVETEPPATQPPPNSNKPPKKPKPPKTQPPPPGAPPSAPPPCPPGETFNGKCGVQGSG